MTSASTIFGHVRKLAMFAAANTIVALLVFRFVAPAGILPNSVDRWVRVSLEWETFGQPWKKPTPNPVLKIDTKNVDSVLHLWDDPDVGTKINPKELMVIAGCLSCSDDDNILQQVADKWSGKLRVALLDAKANKDLAAKLEVMWSKQVGDPKGKVDYYPYFIMVGPGGVIVNAESELGGYYALNAFIKKGIAKPEAAGGSFQINKQN